MTEEEKKAIEIAKNICINTYAEGKAKAINIILNLVEKLQKENEEYKKQFVPTPEHPIPVEYQTSIFVDKRDYISKNIIRKKLDYVDNNIHLVNPYSREDIYEMGKLHGIGEFCKELLREE